MLKKKKKKKALPQEVESISPALGLGFAMLLAFEHRTLAVVQERTCSLGHVLSCWSLEPRDWHVKPVLIS